MTETVKKEKMLTIMIQAFYGNRNLTRVRESGFDQLILGIPAPEFYQEKGIDRTIIPLEGTDHLVLVYNRYQEEERLKKKEKLLEEENYVLKPLAYVPERDLYVYSRCAVCRIDENGELDSLQKEDLQDCIRYLYE